MATIYPATSVGSGIDTMGTLETNPHYGLLNRPVNQVNPIIPAQDFRPVSSIAPATTNPLPGDTIRQSFADAGIASSALPYLSRTVNDIAAQKQQIEAAGQSRLDAIRQGINSQFDNKIQDARETGIKEVSGVTAQLGDTRGLGFSSSRANFIDQKKADNQKYIDSLEKARADALNTADLNSADKIANEIKDARDYAFKLESASRDEYYKALDEGRAQQTADEAALNQKRDDNLKMLDQIAKTGGSLDTGTLAKFDANFGTPGFSQSYLDTAKHAMSIKTANDLADFKLKLIPLAEKLPVGQTMPITLPDGSVYQLQGTMESKHSTAYTEWQDYKSTGGKLDFNAYQNMDANRHRSVTNINNGGAGELPPTVQKDLDAYSALLSGKYKAPDTQFTESNAYRRVYAEFAAKYPKYAKDFLKYFPPEAMLDPNDPRNATLFGANPKISPPTS